MCCSLQGHNDLDMTDLPNNNIILIGLLKMDKKKKKRDQQWSRKWAKYVNKQIQMVGKHLKKYLHLIKYLNLIVIR